MSPAARKGLAILPAQAQPQFPLRRFIVREAPDPDAVPMDVVFVGGGPAGLAGAIELARLAKADALAGGAMGELQIGVLEKASALGEHSLSGAVVNPGSLRALFPDLSDAEFPFRGVVDRERVYLLGETSSMRIPTPPTMRNHGNYIASLSEMVRWMGERAEALGVNIFTGFPADVLLVEGDRVVGVRTTPTGLGKSGEKGVGYSPWTDVTARVTVLAEGTRGALTQAYLSWQQISSENPQIFALGVKEIWETRRPLDAVVHTLGWPLPRDAFGGSFMYPLAPTLVAIGLVVGLDYREASFDPHEMMQRMKLHPLFRQYLDGGEMVEWGAKTIPEGGYFSLPKRRYGDGLLIAGDAAGFVEVASLKGIHHAIRSGILAARAIFNALRAGDTSAAALAPYDQMVNESEIVRDLYARRNMRLAFHDGGFFFGGAQAALMTLTGGVFRGRRIPVVADADVPKRVVPPEPFAPDGVLTFKKLDAVFKSGNATRDTIPSHLIVGQDISAEMAEFYVRMCPAGVYERDGDRLIVNAPNCIDCKATDVLGPRWTPREGGSGPKYRRM